MFEIFKREKTKLKELKELEEKERIEKEKREEEILIKAKELALQILFEEKLKKEEEEKERIEKEKKEEEEKRKKEEEEEKRVQVAFKQRKEIATRNGQPFIEIVGSKLTENGLAIRMDWNSKFIEMCKKAGMTGDEDTIVHSYLNMVSRHVQLTDIAKDYINEKTSEFE
jgi:hypothetical protein